ncbi:uncharacterized protein LOC109531848 isoform X2 [Hippocampus comes]|uniref:Uncharacterized LOC109531848 n=2 Tax=Hippocampus comes TaxID=109280 RepID=A0A3Q2YXN7_HIPCM|nr:PREDICTED: uncharacterized protein LOC109531848 isoform X2 [Hippocampus comes]
MTMSGGLALCCAALLLSIASVCAVQRLNTINDLKKVNFGQAVPKHSLVLLHWFANIIDIDNNDVIRLPFDPNLGTYGSHHYGNYERMLNPLPRGNIRYRYYTVGNLNQGQSDLPDYVLNPPNAAYQGRNRDRIIFRVREHDTRWQNGETVDEVYITQHYENSNEGTRYDPAHTYQITINLLRQIREFSVEDNQSNSLTELREDFGSNIDDSQLRSLKITWRELACLGLLLYMVLEEKYQRHNKPRPAAKRNAQPHCVVDIPENRENHHDVLKSWRESYGGGGTQLEVTTESKGKAGILWRGVPKQRLKERVMVVLYKDNNAQEAMYSHVIASDLGQVNTSVPLNVGLQARLHKTKKKFCFWTVPAEEICRGEEIRNPEKVRIHGYDASLQLFVKDGKACARLFVNRAFENWKTEFKRSWVGFYANSNKSTKEYEWWRWQWATKFKPASSPHDHDHDVYEYHSGMAIAPGVQARFILRNDIVMAQTSSWS